MTVTWVNKAGADRGRTDLVREEGITSMNFQGTGSFEGLTADEIKELLDRTPGLVPEVGEKTPGKVRSWRHQIVSFRDDMEVDDRILTPLPGDEGFAIGVVLGTYEYQRELDEEGASHTRRVKWSKKVLGRADLGDDLYEQLQLRSRTVYRPRKNNAQARLNNLDID
ncbi:hypothetical protein OG389_16540 [Streptomyces sp. NBC_00435]|uniref:hypothetical protein n=1 Tax=Streptomyces sp. NBC_00435 TaxID=2903649 RepID=UPI002E1C547D